uniref:Uncharacterized protein n=1 Tax=Leersia perrieri TaxID=77586 RepID=A0A0D9VC17_9ORYZ
MNGSERDAVRAGNSLAVGPTGSPVGPARRTSSFFSSSSFASLRIPSHGRRVGAEASSGQKLSLTMPPKLLPPPMTSKPSNKWMARSGAVIIRMLQAPAVVALSAMLAVSTSPSPAVTPQQQEAVAATADEEDGGGGASTLCNVPPTLSGEDKQAEKIKHPKSASAARCTSKCVSTCILGGAGSPGVDGPFNIRRPLVVFKEDFRSRQYCLLECSDICNLIKDGEDGQ